MGPLSLWFLSVQKKRNEYIICNSETWFFELLEPHTKSLSMEAEEGGLVSLTMRRVWLTVLVVLCSGIGAIEEAVGEQSNPIKHGDISCVKTAGKFHS